MTVALPKGLFHETSTSLEAAPDLSLLGTGSAVELKVKSREEYINLDDGGWATYASKSKTKYVIVPAGDVSYIVVADGPYKNYYLSYNDRYYIGAYKNWDQARYWRSDPVDVVRYPGMYYYNNFLCCNGESDAPDKLITIVTT